MEGSREDIKRERKVGVSAGQARETDPSDFTNKNINLIHRLRSHSVRVHIVEYSSGHQDTYPHITYKYISCLKPCHLNAK